MNDETRIAIMKTAIKLSEEGHEIERIEEAIIKLYPLIPHSATTIAISGIEMYVSLRQAVDKANGPGWGIDELCKMTVMNLISCLATNNVRFIFESPKGGIRQ